MSVNNVYAIEAAFDVLEHPEAEERRRRLFRLCRILRNDVVALEKRLARPVLRLMDTPPPTSQSGASQPPATAILPLLTSRPHALAAYLQARGYLVRPVVPPTVPKGLERVRVCLHAGNKESDVRDLVRAIDAWAQQELVGSKAKL